MLSIDFLMTPDRSLSQIQIPSVADAVYDVLRRQILHGHLSPREQLNLTKLETDLSVSRTPLKMALARLQNEGLIAIQPRRGTFVAHFTELDIRECFELRIALEAEALRSVFEPYNAEQLADIVTLFERMGSFYQNEATWLDELLDFMDYDRQVHLRMIALAHNARIQHAYEQANLQGYIAVMGKRFVYQDALQTQAEHRDILAALRKGRLPHLLAAARAHLENARDRAVLRLTGEGA